MVAGADADPRGKFFGRRKRRCTGAGWGHDLLRRIHAQTGHLRQALDRILVGRSRSDLTHEESSLAEGNVAALALAGAMTCCAESTPRPGTSAKRSTGSW